MEDRNEFKSRLEEIIPAEELLFEPTPAFGDYKQYLEHAVAHPAKANTKLLEFLILNFTNEGDIILDPMAGSGSTGVVAALHNRNAIQIDIEPKFYEFMEKARENVEKAPTLAPKGWIKNILGDARRLSELLSRADIVITSPPYTNSAAENPNVYRYRKGGMFAEEKINAIITSPPYLNVDNVKENSEEFWRKAKELGKRWGSKPPSGTEDKQITSPENIGNLKSSDDEYQALSEGRIQELVKKLMKNGKPTYLSEMLKVYREVWKVLKPGGRAIIIVKPFQRNKKVVDLPYYTYLLMKACSFELEKLYKLRLKHQSFWRVLYYRRFPTIPRIAHEYVLICRKQKC